LGLGCGRVLVVMLYADKQALETDLKVSLLAIRERELNLYSDNFRNIGTQAALLAGFAYSGCTITTDFVESGYQGTDGATHQINKQDFEGAFYIFITTAAMSLNVCALFSSVTCCMFGPGLALRGPDGSMDQAVEGLALEYRMAIIVFLTGLFCFYLSATVFVMLEDFSWSEAIILATMFCYFGYTTVGACKRIYKKFRLTAETAVVGSFNADGTTGQYTNRKSVDQLELERLCSHKRLVDWPRRQRLYLRIFWDEFLGISSSLQQQRFDAMRLRGDSTEKRYNYKIHNILRHLELPSHITHHTPRIDPVLGGRRASDSRAASSSSSGSSCIRPISSSRTPHKVTWFGGRRSTEETRSLPASCCNELESCAMAPHDHLTCGALSPPGSDNSEDSK